MGLDRAAVDVDRVRAGDPGRAGDDVDAHRTKAVGVVVGGCDLGLHCANARPYRGVVDLWFGDGDAELAGRPGVVRDLGRGE